jgi:monoamine oxidase
MATEHSQVDVVIIGAGLSGLAAAATLKAVPAERRVSYLVLEASDRKAAGGRTHTGVAPGYLDFGGAYIGGVGSQNYINHFVQKYSLKTLATSLPAQKRWIYEDAGGKFATLPGNQPLDLPGNPESVMRLAELDELALSVRAQLDRPWSHPLAREWDAMTVADWMTREKLSPETTGVMTAAVRSTFSAEPGQLSFLFFLWYAATAGNFSQVVDVTNRSIAAEGRRFTYGTRDLVEALIREVANGQPDQNIKWSTAASSLHNNRTGVTVATSDGPFSAKYAIVAMSPFQCRTLEFEGDGAAARKELQNNMSMGHTIKGFLFFEKAFWNDLGFSGYFLSDNGDYKEWPLDWTLDNSWTPTEKERNASDRSVPAQYSLMTFIVGASADYWSKQPLEDRREAVIDHVAKAFGPTTREHLVHDKTKHYYEKDWSVQKGLGGPTGILGPNILTRYPDALRRPVERIHWAGTETAHEWMGYMNGAIASGVRAANEVIGRLQSRRSPPRTSSRPARRTR